MKLNRFFIRTSFGLFLLIFFLSDTYAQDIIPFDTTNWDIQTESIIHENYRGYDAVYMRGGSLLLKNTTFINGTIEFDVFLTERQGFPGVNFRTTEGGNSEQFYIRPHLPGKPDANQATPVVNGFTGWQLYFGEEYSVPYDYNYEDWTHVKLVVNDDKAQVFFDYSDEPQLSWYLKHPPREGSVSIGGGGQAPMHYANFKINKDESKLFKFNVTERAKTEGIIKEWTISDKFEESRLNELSDINKLIQERSWDHKIKIEENDIANISWAASRFGDGNTVFAKLIIKSNKDQVKLFEFGYSDRVVAILNGTPIYKGNNGWRTRDYRYLGTVGLFDSIYLNLKKGDNELLFAVSESFGGWGITGRFIDYSEIEIN
ncbi:MAG: hypothetical protein JJ892_02015 [Balneola sp.]|nr:hypothetical protein [Balneola sp.]MBO6651151.1 hypothetical protein [Balneola sp.]MBO6710340.1 hypothetical protein [Balneola sp.]MBO6799025.1 hypothetical protein [Balneola sp.]MBO6870139.1 hypothetical protein [Balneola sp.]